MGAGRSPRGRGDTRQAILLTATRLFLVRGYHGFSFHQLADELDVRTATVHYHFPSKADLGVALLRRFRDEFDWWRACCDQLALTGAARLERFYTLDRGYVAEGRVCPLGVVGVEYTGLPVAVQREADSLIDEVHAYLVTSVTAGRADGSLTMAGEPDAVAHQVLAATQGALQLSRVQGDASYESVVRGLRAMLEAPA
jgi:AcrR family transcriptional regulator